MEVRIRYAELNYRYYCRVANFEEDEADVRRTEQCGNMFFFFVREEAPTLNSLSGTGSSTHGDDFIQLIATLIASSVIIL